MGELNKKLDEILLEQAVENRMLAVKFYNNVCHVYEGKTHIIRLTAEIGMLKSAEAERLLREQIYGA